MKTFFQTWLSHKIYLHLFWSLKFFMVRNRFIYLRTTKMMSVSMEIIYFFCEGHEKVQSSMRFLVYASFQSK